MRKTWFIGLFSIFSIAIGIHILTQTSDHPIVQQDGAIGKIKAQIEVLPFEQSVIQTDLIAKIRIVNKVSELSEPSPKTLFQAEIIDVIKEDTALSNKVIHILQNGNSKWHFNENEMFSNNKEYVLFLKKAIGLEDQNTYWILGEETGIYKVVDNGKIAKQAVRDEKLTDIEDKKLSQAQMQQHMASKEIQVVDSLLFKEKINNILKEYK